MLSSIINKWILYDGAANLEKIFAEIRKINDFTAVLNVYMELYRKHVHAQKRYLLIKLLDHLLMKFTNDIGILVMEHLMEIVELSQGRLLPKDWSLKLKEFIFQSLEKWANEYQQYRAFKIAYQQILDFHDGDRSRVFFPKKEISKKMMQVYEKSFQTVYSDFTKSKDDLREMEQKLETSIELLLQTQNIFDKKILCQENSSKPGVGMPLKSDIHKYGLGSSSYNLQLSIDVSTLKLDENEDNSVLFQEIREGCKVIEKKYIPSISKWTKKVAKVQMNTQHETFLKELINARSRLDQILTNVRNLGISWNLPRALIPPSGEALESDDGEEFLMVPPETPTPNINKNSQSANEEFPGSSNDPPLEYISDKSDEKQMAYISELSTEKANLLEMAPVVPYDEDLEYWDKTDVPFNTSGLEFQHRFLGTGSGERMLSKETLRKLKMRTIALPVPNKVSIERSCNAPLKNGKLCRRKDLTKCPVHGVIIERDSEGIPLDETIGSASESIPEWQKLEDLVNRAHPMDKRKSQIEDIKKKTSKQRIDSKLSKRERERSSSEAFDANLKLRDRQAFRW